MQLISSKKLCSSVVYKKRNNNLTWNTAIDGQQVIKYSILPIFRPYKMFEKNVINYMAIFSVLKIWQIKMFLLQIYLLHEIFKMLECIQYNGKTVWVYF